MNEQQTALILPYENEQHVTEQQTALILLYENEQQTGFGPERPHQCDVYSYCVMPTFCW